jgi:hypothetical protein
MPERWNHPTDLRFAAEDMGLNMRVGLPFEEILPSTVVKLRSKEAYVFFLPSLPFSPSKSPGSLS